MNISYILLGGNIGDREKNFKNAAEHITRKVGKTLQASSIYETEPWGVTHQPNYYNQVLKVETHLPAIKLMQALLQIEEQMGRVRTNKYSPRIIDIDVLFFNEEVINTDNLIVPHPMMQKRKFVLEPLYEIAPNLLHPVLKKNIGELLDVCEDNSFVYKL